jgi:hypothetical protein
MTLAGFLTCNAFGHFQGGSLSNQGFEITSSATEKGQFASLTPGGSNTTNHSFAYSEASVSGVEGTISATSEGTYTHTVTWVGIGPAPKYAYVLVTEAGFASIDWFATADISISLPVVSSGDNFKRGRKIVKLDIGSNGSKSFTTSGKAKVIATGNSENWLDSSGSSSYSSTATLEFKALGLSYDSNMRVETLGVGLVPSVISASAGGDDFESQNAELGVNVKLKTVSVPQQILGFDPEPLTEQVFDSADYNFVTSIGRIGNWLQRPSPANGTGSSSVDQGNRVDLYTSSGHWNEIRCFNNLPEGQIESMRTTPLLLTVKAEGKDPLSPEWAGPFKGTLKMKLWAPERIIRKEPRTVTDINYLPLTSGSRVFKAEANVPATQGTSIATTSGAEIAGEVSLSTGTTLPPLGGFGVKIDAGVKLGKKWTRFISGSTGITFQAKLSAPLWTRCKLIEKHSHLDRVLAVYGQTGYAGDIRDTIVDYKAVESETSWVTTPYDPQGLGN